MNLTIVLDPGHGGDEVAGKSTPYGAQSPDGAAEKDFNLTLAQRVSELYGGMASLTRDGDYNLPIAQRIDAARQRHARSFISIHSTPQRGDSRNGDVWVHPQANAESLALAHNLASALNGTESVVRQAELSVLSPDRFGGPVAACMVECSHWSPAGYGGAWDLDERVEELAPCIVAGVSQFMDGRSWGAPHARGLAVASRGKAFKKTTKAADDYYDNMVLLTGMVARLRAGTTYFEKDLAKTDRDFVDRMYEQYSGSGAVYDWVTDYNPLRWGMLPSDPAKLVRELVDRAKQLNVDENLAKIEAIYENAKGSGKGKAIISSKEAKRQALISKTMTKARDFVLDRPKGPKKDEGKTVAALCVLDTGKIFSSTSGAPEKRKWMPRTGQLLTKVEKREEWPVKACAEVHALDKAISAKTTVNPGQTRLYSYCFTWHKDVRQWKGRAACKNCSQWLKRFK